MPASRHPVPDCLTPPKPMCGSLPCVPPFTTTTPAATSSAKRIVHGVEDHARARRSTALPGIRKRRRERPLDGTVEVGVVANDERVLSAQLEHNLRQPSTAVFRDPPPRLCRSREADQVDLR